MKRVKWIQSKKNYINKLRDRNEHMIMGNEKTNIVGAGFKIKLDIINQLGKDG